MQNHSPSLEENSENQVLSSPRVSVLLPTFNRASYIGETIASVLVQSYRDFEIVVVDDGSTDQTARIVQSIADPRVRYIYQPNRGVAAALNTAWRAAAGEYLAMIGSDDVWLPHLLAELESVLDTDSTLDLVYARAQGIDAYGKPLPQILGAPPKFPDAWLASLLYGDCICGIAAIFRRRCIARIGGFDESLVANEDWDLWIRMAEHCRFAYRPLILARFRMHPQSLTGGRSQHYARVVLDRVRLIEHYYARADVPAQALEIKKIACRNVHMDVAIRYLSIGQWRMALSFFFRTIRVAPNPITAAIRVLAVTIFDLYLSKTGWGVRLVDVLVERRRKTDHKVR